MATLRVLPRPRLALGRLPAAPHAGFGPTRGLEAVGTTNTGGATAAAAAGAGGVGGWTGFAATAGGGGMVSQQTRGARLMKRPRRPYEFTQLVQLSDGSTYLSRTTSPLPLYRSAKDKMNHVLWQPSDRRLASIGMDESGTVAAFRSRFGLAWDAADSSVLARLEGVPATAAGDTDNTGTDPSQTRQIQQESKGKDVKLPGEQGSQTVDQEDDVSMMDLLSTYAEQSGIDYSPLKSGGKKKKKKN